MSTGTPTTHIYPKTNISKVYYRHLVDSIEHDPLIRHSTLTIAGFVAAIAIMAGVFVWYAASNPGNLIQTNAVVTGISSGKTDAMGGTTTFVSFDFDSKVPAPMTGKTDLNVRQPAIEGVEYKVGQMVKIGYHPKNPGFARLLNDTRPPAISLALWIVPGIIMIGLMFLALFRHHNRQMEIWAAADAAESDD